MFRITLTGFHKWSTTGFFHRAPIKLSFMYLLWGENWENSWWHSQNPRFYIGRWKYSSVYGKKHTHSSEQVLWFTMGMHFLGNRTYRMLVTSAQSLALFFERNPIEWFTQHFQKLQKTRLHLLQLPTTTARKLKEDSVAELLEEEKK
jgi:hypothetical protein